MHDSTAMTAKAGGRQLSFEAQLNPRTYSVGGQRAGMKRNRDALKANDDRSAHVFGYRLHFHSQRRAEDAGISSPHHATALF